jgi:hypothetical protein
METETGRTTRSHSLQIFLWKKLRAGLKTVYVTMMITVMITVMMIFIPECKEKEE